MTLDAFLQAILADPLHAEATWQVLADWLEDQGDARSELVRLLRQPDYRRNFSPEQRDNRVRELLASGVQPVAPIVENSIGMKFALIPPGVFLMGSPEGESGRGEDETQHEVEITQPFFLGVHPVTQEDYQRVMGNNPSYFAVSGDGKGNVMGLDTRRFPVESVSWDEAVSFCERLSNLPEQKEAGRRYRLPSEAEWEYACRGEATSSQPFHFGDSLSSTQANFDGNNPYGGAAKGPYLERPCPVGSYPANAFGVFDMHGNVWEWCHNWYDENYYGSSPKKDPQGSDSGSARVLRGGSWLTSARFARSAYRGRGTPAIRHLFFGFRVAFRLD